ncbi:MAG: hypothetical protein Q9165_002054 [Trypethelium subeluteriae]
MTYVNPQSVIAVGVIFPLLGLVAVTLRFLLRHKRKTGLSWDDWLCIPALVLVWAEGAVIITGSATHSFGYHSPAYDIDNPENFLTDDQSPVRMLGMSQLQTVFDLINPAALALIKLSILFFYRRIFRGRVFEIISWVTCAIIILWAVTFTITIAAACGTHLNANWKSLLVLKEECVDTFRILLAYSVTDAVVDLTLVIIPIPLRRRLRDHTACFLQDASVAGLPATDDLGVVSLLVFWGMVELGVGMVAICLPTLRPLLAGVSPEGVIRSIRNTTKTMQRVGSDASEADINMNAVYYANTPGLSVRNTVTGTTEDGRSAIQIASPRKGGIRVDREFEMYHQEVELR